MTMVGIDVGGTWTRVGVVDRTGRVLASQRSPTLVGFSQSAPMVDFLSRTMSETIARAGICNADVQGVGLALPGTLDGERAMLVRSVNLPALEGKPIRDEFATKVGHPVALLTDAEAATWGEYKVRQCPPQTFVHLRLGTGIACGVVVDGRLRRLDEGRSSHLPVLVVDTGPGAMRCRCGQPGCLETVASGGALAARAQRAGYSHGLESLRSAWKSGDSGASEIVEHAADALAVAFVNLAGHYRAEIICVGGGVLGQLPGLLDEAATRFRADRVRLSAQAAASMAGRNLVPAAAGVGICDVRVAKDGTPTSEPVSFEPSRLGDDAGVIGAALLAMEQV